MVRPAFRSLRGYSLDPGFSTRLDTASINEVTYNIPFESLKPGPTGEYIEVVDYDPASGCWYDPIDLSHEELAVQDGHAPSEGNPQFHQQFVYAVAMKTIDHFEKALGRKITWHPRAFTPRERRPKHDDQQTRRAYVQRLRIYPHAMREANAYYNSDKLALLFSYFTAASQIQGANHPGGTVFTCLSPDIVAHETTHAILDSIHHRYMEDTNLDVAAFHEGFADIVALLQRFTFSEMVEHQLAKSRGRFDGATVFGQLATQFGEALQGSRGALRNMIGKWDEKKGQWTRIKADPSDYRDNTEAHDRGAVLVATIFDAFQRIYEHRTSDLVRIATGGTGVLPEGSISTDLVRRLAKEAQSIAEHLLAVCIRALDYCPPIDITFGDYLRATITADVDIAPRDEGGYRIALIEAFRARGILPDRVNTLSVESLVWNTPELNRKQQSGINTIAKLIQEGVRELAQTEDRHKLFKMSKEIRTKLEKRLNRRSKDFTRREWEALLKKFGLTAEKTSKLFDKKFKDKFIRDGEPAVYTPFIEVHSLRPVYRTSRREGKLIEQVLVTLTQRISTLINEGNEPERRMVFRGGCTIIVDLGALNKVFYVISKNIKNRRRYDEQRKYLRGEKDDVPPPSTSIYSDDDRNWRLDFNLLHQHD
jgi:hypothetical protein